MTSRAPRQTVDAVLTAAVLLVSATLWFAGLLGSPVMQPEALAERRFVDRYVRDNAPDLEAERELARAYWRRYADVREDGYYGENGPGGIFGARDHFRQHGRREGRIFAPLPEGAAPERERRLAEAYWRRYPDVAASPVWGREGALGVLGPRDHYVHVGRRQGKVWGDEGGHR